MKKNIYLIIITIITVVCIIAGSLYHIGGFALGLFDNLIPRSDKSLGKYAQRSFQSMNFQTWYLIQPYRTST